MTDELCHHGILGMKWGIRRYQNTDGTLTPKGKKRHDKLTGSRKEAKLKKKLKKKYGIYEKIGKSFVNNNRMMNDAMMNNTIQQANQYAMEQANRAAINASLQAASLSMSGGMNPFMFGMI